MLSHCLIGICEIDTTMLPVKMSPRVPYLDMATFLFCVILMILTMIVVLNRRQFGFILKALFVPRVRSQLLRETKVFGEWIYASTLVFNFLVQGMLLFLLAQYFLSDSVSQIGNFGLYFLSVGLVLVDYFVKMFWVGFLSEIFNCQSDRQNFNLNKFFYGTANSVALFPLLILAVYMRQPAVLFAYVPLFLTTYVTMFMRTWSLKSANVKPFQFFLYFCTLEILPYLIVLKLAISI